MRRSKAATPKLVVLARRHPMRVSNPTIPLFLLTIASLAQAQDQPAAERKSWADENVQVEAHHFKRYRFMLFEDSDVSVRLNVRNNAPVSYYIMPGPESDLYQGGSRDTFFHVREFYGERVRTVSETRCLAEGVYALVVVSGAAQADLELRLESAPTTGANGPVLRPQTIPLGNANPGSNGAGRYRLSVVGFNVSPRTKANKPWDADGSGPDVSLQLAWGDGTGVSNFQRVGSEQTYNDTWAKRAPSAEEPLAAWEFDWNGRGDIIVAAWDRDTLSHDLIAAGTIQSGADPGAGVVVLRSDLSSIQGGKFGRNAANGEIALLLVWRKVQ